MTERPELRGSGGDAAAADNVVALAPYRDARHVRRLQGHMASLDSDARAIAVAGDRLDGTLRRLTGILTIDEDERVAARRSGDETRQVMAAIESGDLERMLALRAELEARRDEQA